MPDLDNINSNHSCISRIVNICTDPGFSTTTPQPPNLSEKCAEKCSEEIALLKKNMSQLLTAFVTLREQFEHMKQHLIFHEKALKHIAVWGHKPVRPHSQGKNFDDEPDIDLKNGSALTEQNNETNRDMKSVRDRHRNHLQHRHQHDHHHHNHHNHHNHQHSQDDNRGCRRCPPQSQKPPKWEDVQIEDKIAENKTTIEEKKKDSSEESSEEVVKPLVTTIEPESDPKTDSGNASMPLNDSHVVLSPEKSAKDVRFTRPMMDEQLYFQSMEEEFKDWFNNLLYDIHRDPSERRSNRLNKESKDHKRSDQSAIDEMDNILNSEDLVFATCNIKPNRHIALLNQQDIEGTINMWQLSNNRGPLHMHIKLKGFKVNNHEHNGRGRRRRESILMPIEQEPDDGQPVGASHSHGFHVHEFGNLSRDCQSVGTHYNPLNLAHGGPFDVVRHVGDLGNIRCNKNGEIDKEYSYSQVSLSGPHSIVNRSLVVSDL